MLSFAERFIAWRYLRPKRDDRFLSVIAGFSFIGIAIGVATLIIVMSVMNGFRQELLKQILGVNGHITVYAVGESFTNYEDMAFAIRRLPEVRSVMPLVEGQAMLTINGTASGAAVRGIKASDFKQKTVLSQNLNNPAMDDFYGRDVVIIGQQMAERYSIRLGDNITLVAPDSHDTIFGSVPRLRSFRVVDTFKTGMFEYDRNFIYMPLEAAQVFFQYGDGVPALEVFATHPDKLKPVVDFILNGFDMPISIRDWKEANTSFLNALQVERNVMFLILTLIILVAAFNIISSLIMLVKDKGRNIAILRTMGASKRQIIRIFMLNGITIGMVGTLVGFVGGVVFTLNIESIRRFFEQLLGTNLFPDEIYFLSTLPAQIEWVEVGSVVGLTLLLSFLATLYPAWKAASLDPVEMLRNE